MGKLTISTGPFSSSQTVNVYQRVTGYIGMSWNSEPCFTRSFQHGNPPTTTGFLPWLCPKNVAPGTPKYRIYHVLSCFSINIMMKILNILVNYHGKRPYAVSWGNHWFSTSFRLLFSGVTPFQDTQLSPSPSGVQNCDLIEAPSSWVVTIPNILNTTRWCPPSY